MEKKLTSQDKNELKKLVNVTDDPDTLTSFIMSKTNEDFEDDNMSNYWDDGTLHAVEPQDIINFIKSNRDIDDYNEMVDVVCTQFNIDSDDAKDWLDVAGYEGASNTDEEVHESFHLLESEDNADNHDDIYDMLIDEYVGRNVIFYTKDLDSESPEDREFISEHNGLVAQIILLDLLANDASIGTEYEFSDLFWDILFADNEKLSGISGYSLHLINDRKKIEVENITEDVIYMDKELLKDRYGTDDFDLVNAGNEDTIVEIGKEEEEEPVNKIEVESLNEDIGDPVNVKTWYGIKCTYGYYDDRKVCFGNAVKNRKVSVLVVAGGFVSGGSQVRFLDPDSAKAFAMIYIPNSGYYISDYAIVKSKATDTLYEVNTEYGTAYMTGRKLHELTSKGKKVLPERKRIEID